MDISYLNFQLGVLEVQLNLAGATLSDYDLSQNRARSADGKWAKSPSALSENEKLDALLEKDRGVWRVDSATRQKQISDIAQTLAKADKETQVKILTELAPALSQLGDDLDGVDIEERKRIVSDLDEKLSELLSKNQANRLITDLILDIDEFDYDAKWTGIHEEATANLEETLAKVSTIKSPKLADHVKQSFQNTIAQFFPKKPLPQEPSPEEKLRKVQEQEVKDAESVVSNLRKTQERAVKNAESAVLNLKKAQEPAVKDAESAVLNIKKAQEKLREDQAQEQKAKDTERETKIAERKALNLKRIQENLTPEQQFQKTVQETVQEKLGKAQEQEVKDAKSAVLNLKEAQEQEAKDAAREVLNLKKAQEQEVKEAEREVLNLKKAQEQKIKDAEREVLNLKKAQEQKIKDAAREAQDGETSLARLRTQKQTREQLKQVGKNAQELFNDIATMTVAGFEASTKKLAEAGIGEKLEKISQAVEQAVTDFFKNNIEAYYERQSEKGKLQQEVVREILDKAKEKAQAKRDAA